MPNIQNVGEIFINRKLVPMIVKSINENKRAQQVVIENIYDENARNYCEKNGNYFSIGPISTRDLIEKLNNLGTISDSTRGITCLFDYTYISYINKIKYNIMTRSPIKDGQLYEIPFKTDRKEELLADKSKRSIVKLEIDGSIIQKISKLKEKIK